jgi:hypothetical protein
MRHLRSIGVVAIVLLTMATPSKLMAQSWWEGFANAPQPNSFWGWLQQYPNVAGQLQQNPYQIYDPSWRRQYPELQQYIGNNPDWWNSVRSGGSRYYDGPFNRFLINHPQIARDLRQNPELIYDPRYRARHPELKEFLASHKRIWQSIKNQRYVYSRSGGWGAYNNSNQWRDETWWKDNGDWDQQNKWRDRDWWRQNNRTLAEQRHPNWFDKHEAHEAAKEAKHRRRQGHGQNEN